MNESDSDEERASSWISVQVKETSCLSRSTFPGKSSFDWRKWFVSTKGVSDDLILLSSCPTKEKGKKEKKEIFKSTLKFITSVYLLFPLHLILLFVLGNIEVYVTLTPKL